MTKIELYHGSCLDYLDYLAGFKKLVIIADPPYGKSLANHSPGGRRRKGSYEIVGDEDQNVGLTVSNWAAKRRLPTAFFAAPDLPWPGKWRNYLVWDKGGAVGGGGDPGTCWKRTWELIQIARNKMYGSRDEGVLKFPVGPGDSPYHPAQKPVALMTYLIEKLTAVDDIVVDPFMGSGSTGVAAVLTGRQFVGMESAVGHFTTAQWRIDNTRGLLRAELEEQGQLSLLSLGEIKDA